MDLKTLTTQLAKVSQIYADRFNINRDDNWHILKIQEELGELTQSYLMLTGQGRQKGLEQEELKNNFENEIADVLCMTLLLAHHHKVDVEKVIEEKWLKWLEK
jgi:NTP pyrophosphatase (non-canonical NTP hydrolase)